MINLSIPQILLAAIALVFVWATLAKFIKRQRSQSFFKLFANLFIWCAVLFFALFPKLPHFISDKLGFGDSLNTLIFIGFILVFIIIFKLINIIERVERNISEIVRKEALNKLEK